MRFKVFLVLFLFSVSLVYSQQDGSDEWYVGKPIKDIVFSGIKNIAGTELEALMNPYKGLPYDDYLYLEILTKLFTLEYFSNIEVSTHRADALGDEVILRFTVTENPVIGRINFTGNSGLRRNELLETISTRVNDFHSPAKIRADVEAIKLKYTEKGYPNAVITVSEIPAGDSSITLVFNCNEGDKITIRKIEFNGNTKFSNNALKSQLSLKVKTLLNDGAFQEAKLLSDIAAITKYYNDRGYIDAAVRDVTRTFDFDDKGTNMTITFMIDEGELFTFGGIIFQGNVIFSSEQLGKLVSSKEGDVVNLSRLQADLQRISDLYYENGYIFNTIERNQLRDSQANILSYNIFIVERGRAYIENITVRGNEKTKKSVILREIPLEPGDVFSKTKVMDAMRNLYNLQFFTMIMPDTFPGSTENLMDLVFTVEEAPTTDVQFGATFSGSADPDTFPISGMIKLNDRNVAGSGNQLGIEINSSVVDTTQFTVNYLHRWIFGLPLSGGIDFSANYTRRFATMNNGSHINPVFEGNEPYAYPDGFVSYEEYLASNKVPPRDYLMEYRQWYLSLGFSTGYRWATPVGNLGVNGGMRFGIIQNMYDADLYRPFDPALRDGNNTWMPKNSFWFSFSLDQRDIFYDPSGGYFLSNRMGIYGIIKEEREHYIKNDFKAQYYLTLLNIPVSEKWSFKTVLAVQGGLAMIFEQPGRELVIENASKLSVDGMFVGRGWSSAYSDKGYLLFDNWIELRIPLAPGILAWDFFFDAAGVETTQGNYFGKDEKGNDNFGLNNWRFSYGGGFRFTIPQFPFRLSLAKRFKFVEGDFTWMNGALFGGDPNDPRTHWQGMDLVISFLLSY
uniref:Outer membrane protein assembly factor BamA n=1 Tax=uncultured bacterium contig00024 TaxID=1181513 RepID=A0A806KKD8_9BACT|nr:putative surface antigen [uncultured bacterium contig00024]